MNDVVASIVVAAFAGWILCLTVVESCFGRFVVSGLGVLGESCAKVAEKTKQLNAKKNAFDFIIELLGDYKKYSLLIVLKWCQKILPFFKNFIESRINNFSKDF
jgi:hypothetical protein